MRIGYVLPDGSVIGKRFTGDNADRPLTREQLLKIGLADKDVEDFIRTADKFESCEAQVFTSWEEQKEGLFSSVEKWYGQDDYQLLYLYRGEGRWEKRSAAITEITEINVLGGRCGKGGEHDLKGLRPNWATCRKCKSTIYVGPPKPKTVPESDM